jgi:hypothetical protein
MSLLSFTKGLNNNVHTGTLAAVVNAETVDVASFLSRNPSLSNKVGWVKDNGGDSGALNSRVTLVESMDQSRR